MNRQLRHLSKLALITVICLSMSACTLIRDGGGDNQENDDQPDLIFNDIPGDATVIDVLILTDLDRGAAGIMTGYYDYLSLLEAALTERGVFMRKVAVAPLYRQQSQRPALLYGRGSEDNLSDSLEETLGYYVSDEGLAHLDGRVDVPGENLAALGMNLDDEPIFNPESSSAEGRAYFDPPEDGLLVVHLTGTRRTCSHGEEACALDGQRAGQYFSQIDDAGSAWLRMPGPASLPPGKIVHLSIATDEDISYDDFRDDCASEPNFPQSYLDFIEHSPKTYFAPFMSDINSAGGLGLEIDLCTAFSTRALTSSLHAASQISGHLN